MSENPQTTVKSCIEEYKNKSSLECLINCINSCKKFCDILRINEVEIGHYKNKNNKSGLCSSVKSGNYKEAIKLLDNATNLVKVEKFEDINNEFKDTYYVYVLTYNDKAIVTGSGRYNRAKVIFDDMKNITTGHKKALFVRLYHLFGNNDKSFKRYLISFKNDKDAKKVEAILHKFIGGNTSNLPTKIKRKLFKDIAKGSYEELLLKMAILSGFSGIDDLKRLWCHRVVSKKVWILISRKLRFKSAWGKGTVTYKICKNKKVL